jgi:hypothetical protein
VAHKYIGPLLWSSGRRSWIQFQRSLVRFPALSNFLKSNVSRTVSTQPCDDDWGATWMKNYRLRSRKQTWSAMGIRYSDHSTSAHKSWHWTPWRTGPLSRYSSLADVRAKEFVSCFNKWRLEMANVGKYWMGIKQNI